MVRGVIVDTKIMMNCRDMIEKTHKLRAPLLSFAFISFALVVPATAHIQTGGVIPKPSKITVDGVPDFPISLADETHAYIGSKAAAPAGVRHHSPTGDATILVKDADGDEIDQLYLIEGEQSTLLTDGKSRYEFGGFSTDGQLIGYTSRMPYGEKTDFYVMNPRTPESARIVATIMGGDWEFNGFRPGNIHALVTDHPSYENRNLYDLNLETAELTLLSPSSKDARFLQPRTASDGTLWVLSDDKSDYLRLGILKDKKFTPMTPETQWDVETFTLVPGGFIAYVMNEAGASRLKLLDVGTRRVRDVALPVGVISELDVNGAGEVAFTLSGPQLPRGAYVLNPTSMALNRSYGTINPKMAAAQLVTVKSFDGESVSGFLYRPDPAKFPGKRPLIIHVHGGPVSQSRPRFLGFMNYYVNELGAALFYPNVRGSNGYGRRFQMLDNGPWKREDAVKDIGAFLDYFFTDPAIDSSSIGVQGPSYGGTCAMPRRSVTAID